MRSIAQRDDIRDLILDAVDVLLARYGYHKMTVEDLAQQVGIGKGTVYLHFPSKEEVVLSHIDRIIDRLLDQLREIADGPDAVNHRLKRMLVMRVTHRLDSVREYSRGLNDLLSSLRSSFLIRRRKHFEMEGEIFAQVLLEGKKAGVFSFSDARRTARALLDATNSFLPYSLSPDEIGRRADIESEVSRVADLLLKGLSSSRPRTHNKPNVIVHKGDKHA